MHSSHGVDAIVQKAVFDRNRSGRSSGVLGIDAGSNAFPLRSNSV
jgi:hypothetical protein